MHSSRSDYAINVVILLACLLSNTANAELNTFPIPGRSWDLTFESPPITKVIEIFRHDYYLLGGKVGRFNVSITVSNPQCKGEPTHRENMECNLTETSKDFHFVKESLKKECRPDFCKAVYDFSATTKDGQITKHHARWFVVRGDEWLDIQLSIDKPASESDLKLWNQIDSTLKFGTQGGANDVFTLDIGGASIRIPSSWKFVSQAVPDSQELLDVRKTIVHGENMQMAIASMKFSKKRIKSEKELDDAHFGHALRYALVAHDPESPTTTLKKISNNQVRGAYSSLTCKSEKNCFKITQDKSWDALTVATLQTEDKLVIITTGLESHVSESSKKAIEAIKSVGSTRKTQ